MIVVFVLVGILIAPVMIFYQPEYWWFWAVLSVADIMLVVSWVKGRVNSPSQSSTPPTYKNNQHKTRKNPPSIYGNIDEWANYWGTDYLK